MKKTVICLFSFAFLLLSIYSCGTKVIRVSPDTETDLSGRWNDTDSRLVAEVMVEEALSRPWVNNFQEKNNNKLPMVIVGTVLNRSHEHINVQTFTKDLERELTNSGRARFVASKSEREEIREERLDQQTNSSAETRKALRNEYGADYMLQGTINTILDEKGSTKIIYYQVTLEMVDIESNIKVWFGDKKIKKKIRKSFLGL